MQSEKRRKKMEKKKKEKKKKKVKKKSAQNVLGLRKIRTTHCTSPLTNQVVDIPK